MSSPKVVFIINSLTGGGAERALINILGNMSHELAACEVHLVLLDDEPAFHTVPAWVQKHILGADHSWPRSVFLLTKRLRRISPDLVISFLNRSNCVNIVASKILGYPCIICERVHTTSHFPRSLSGLIAKAIVRMAYPRADHVVAVSEGIRADLTTNFGVRPSQIEVIANPIDVRDLEKQAALEPAIRLPKQFILGIGRLVPNKNFHLLVDAYHRSRIEEPLVILGDGPCRDSLMEAVREKRLEGRVQFPGYARNPYPIIRRARLLVSSSSAEGFPNALVEAMALGCPVVATDCDSGPKEILGGTDPESCAAVCRLPFGILTPMNDPVTLAEAIRLAMRPDIGEFYSSSGRKRSMDFTVDSSVRAYASLIDRFAPISPPGPRFRG